MSFLACSENRPHPAVRNDNTLPLVVSRLMTARGARSLGQGALVAAFTLYLHALGWTAPEIGATLSAALLAGAVLTMAVGPLSDRRGRRRFLLIYEALQAGAALLALITAWPTALVLAAIAGGFGRGANGSAGPFAPLEQAWVAQALPAEKRGTIFSVNAAIGFIGMALGALLAGGVQLLIGPLGPVLAYRPLFLLSLAGSVSAFVLIAGLHEPPSARQSSVRPASPERLGENRMLARLVIANTLNGLGIGMIAPLIAYWFALRFQHGPGTIGPALAASFVLGAIGSVAVARVASRYGLIRPVIVMRGMGLVLLTMVPLVPAFGISAALYALRTGFNQGTSGVRQALVVGLTRDRRGLAASLQNVSIQIPRAVGPLVSGLMLHEGMLRTPFFIAAALQMAYLVLYAWFFRGYAAG
ncbi:MAG: MFS transporter [Nitrospiraceae bacterium]|nr:MFS transporter [Nitrospiraceae bacterium]